MAEQKVSGLVPNPPAPDDWVEIEHEGIDAPTRVHPRTLPHWEKRGWTVVQRNIEAPPTPEQEGAVVSDGELNAADTQPAVEAAAPDLAPTTRKPARGAATGTES